jgi:hypothetical protein
MKVPLSALFAVAILIGGAGCDRGPRPHQLETQLRHDLPVGTPAAQVDAYLTARGWSHSFLPNEHAYLAAVRNVGAHFTFTREDIAIKIVLDNRDRLKQISVTPFFTFHGR